MRKKLRRIAAVATTAVLAVGALAMFAGCTSNSPEVTITYRFNDVEYKVDYVLSRSDSPKTVQHFIDLADAGFYNDTCIHDYTSTELCGGGFTADESGELTEINYFQRVKELEQAGHGFSQSVYYQNGNDKIPLYTVYGEFWKNGVKNEGKRDNVHSKGALVMYYTEKSEAAQNIKVVVDRNDGGTSTKAPSYATNSTTSLFYTYLGASSSTRDDKYAVFGRTKDYGQLQALLDAVAASLPEDDENTPDVDESSATVEWSYKADTLDHRDSFDDITAYFDDVRKGGVEVTFNRPKEPIYVVSVKVTKY